MQKNASQQDTASLFSELNLETAQIAWSELQRFFAAGKLIAVDVSLDLVTVAVTVAQDNKQQIEQWINENKIKPVDDQQAKQWLNQQALLWAVVVKPWVLVQHK